MINGCHTSGKSQGINREFCKLSEKFEIVDKCHGNCQGNLKIADSSPITECNHCHTINAFVAIINQVVFRSVFVLN